MAGEEPEQRGIRRTNSGRVIVFDPVQGTLTTEKARDIDPDKATNQKTAPKWGSRVSIYEESGSKRMIATLNLDKLHWKENFKRHCGLISQIYVIELSHGKTPTAVAVS